MNTYYKSFKNPRDEFKLPSYLKPFIKIHYNWWCTPIHNIDWWYALLHKLTRTLILKANSNGNKYETQYKRFKCFKTALECSAGAVANFYTKWPFVKIYH